MKQELAQDLYRETGVRFVQGKRHVDRVYARLAVDLEEMLEVNVVGVDLDEVCDDAEIRIREAGRQAKKAHQKLEDDLVDFIRDEIQDLQRSRRRDQKKRKENVYGKKDEGGIPCVKKSRRHGEQEYERNTQDERKRARERAEEQKRKEEEERRSRFEEEREQREKEHWRKEYEQAQEANRNWERAQEEARQRPREEKASKEEGAQNRSKNTQDSNTKETRGSQGNNEAERDRLYREAVQSIANLTKRNQDLSATIKALQEELQRRSVSLLAQSWDAYKALWDHLNHPSLQLSFATIPWPMHPQPKTPSDITALAVSNFLFSNLDSGDRSRKDKIKTALLRWHPDKFARVLSRVPEADRPLVEEGVGILVRHLNDELAKEK
ncbi:hypothetical protein JAAARDRAFT_38248 [Jaapia argillacea MUCL 33604]|uniref:Uncharacterized protein n=1 Tax=Jaapia argillacea MUCL 33604 TaxID=933084 RepID=A0A067PI28_9AGAM|nr:hypothetical protein JAAARDRAFT_38248 [Jaapia argillacea MUCL 33604]